MAWLSFYYLLLFATIFVHRRDAEALNTTKASCIPAHAPIDSNVIKRECFPYHKPINGFCKDILRNELLFADKYTQEDKEFGLQLFDTGRKALEIYVGTIGSKACLQAFLLGSCRSGFPRCDLTLSKPMGQPACRESCDYLETICAEEIKMAKAYNEVQGTTGYPVVWRLSNCSLYKYRNAGESPECYYLSDLNTETDKLQNKSCYYGNGLGYRGNVSVTRSGHVCQSWSAQCPHRHRHPLVEYPELGNASNYCRNPGGQGPHGPWCYTTDRNKRWEYCDVKKCPDPAPTKSPSFIKVFSTGANKIFIEWTPVPLPFVHGEPLGFRILIKKIGGDDLIVNTTNMNATSFEVGILEPLTNYSVQVLEFNKNGDGPLCAPWYVQTMPKEYVVLRFTAKIKNQTYKTILQEKNSSEYLKLERIVRSQLKDALDKPEAEEYFIYQIEITRFFPGSVGVEFDITAGLINTTSWSARQGITTTILQNLKIMGLYALNVQAPLPPPANVTHHDITETSMYVTWSAQAHSQPFNISNYTIQYKKTDTSMPYYNALVVDASDRKVKVNNLDSSTNYMMRVAAVNKHGAQPSEPIAFTTKGL